MFLLETVLFALPLYILASYKHSGKNRRCCLSLPAAMLVAGLMLRLSNFCVGFLTNDTRAYVYFPAANQNSLVVRMGMEFPL